MSVEDRTHLESMELNVRDLADGLNVSIGAVSKGLTAPTNYLTFERLISMLSQWETAGDPRRLRLRSFLEWRLRQFGLPLGQQQAMADFNLLFGVPPDQRQGMTDFNSIATAQHVAWFSTGNSGFAAASEIFRRTRGATHPPTFSLIGPKGWEERAIDFISSPLGFGSLIPATQQIAVLELGGPMPPEMLVTADINGRCQVFARGSNREFFEVADGEAFAGNLLAWGLNLARGELPAYLPQDARRSRGIREKEMRLAWFTPPECRWIVLTTRLANNAQGNPDLEQGGGANFLREMVDSALRGKPNPVLKEADLRTFRSGLTQLAVTSLGEEQAKYLAWELEAILLEQI